MALFIEGMTCPLCGKPMHANQERISFSPFVVNELDPLWIFSDGVFHAECVRNHPLGNKAVATHEELRAKTSPQNRRCVVSGKLISEPDHYLGVGILTSDPSDPLYRFNSAQFDRAALADWPERKTFVGLLAEALSSGRMKGKGIEWLLRQLEQPQAGLRSATR
jgi:hypothetical protein